MAERWRSQTRNNIRYSATTADWFYVSIFDNTYSGFGVPFDMGGNAFEIAWDGQGEDRFSPIIASSCTVSFIVKNDTERAYWHSAFQYQEQNVFVRIYTNSKCGNSTPPGLFAQQYLWSGYLLGDISASFEFDSYPFEIKLKFTDSLALLKDHPFVKDETTDPFTYFDDEYDRIINYVAYALQSANVFSRSSSTQGERPIFAPDGSLTSPAFTTFIDWYNQNMGSTNVDPWYECGVQPRALVKYTETGVEPKSMYEFIEALCKVWGARLVFWQNKYNFVPVNYYDNAGVTPPDGYGYDIAVTGGASDCGQIEWRYNNKFITYKVPLNPLAKTYATLSGAKVTYYPPLKRAMATYGNWLGVNLLTTCPASASTSNVDGFRGNIDMGNTYDIGVLKPGGKLIFNWEWTMTLTNIGVPQNGFQNWWQSWSIGGGNSVNQIPWGYGSAPYTPTSADPTMRFSAWINIDLKFTNNDTGVASYAGGNSWLEDGDSFPYVVSSSSNTADWQFWSSANSPGRLNFHCNFNWAVYPSTSTPTRSFKNTSEILMPLQTDPGVPATEGWNVSVLTYDKTIAGGAVDSTNLDPNDQTTYPWATSYPDESMFQYYWEAGPSGWYQDGDVGILVKDNIDGGVGSYCDLDGSQTGTKGVDFDYDPSSLGSALYPTGLRCGIFYIDADGQWSGAPYIWTVDNLGGGSTVVASTEMYDAGVLMFGDGPHSAAWGALKINDGGTWVDTLYDGWGRDSIAGDITITELLCQQILRGQSSLVPKYNMTITRSVANFGVFDWFGPMTLTKVQGSSFFCLPLRIKWNVKMDEWTGTWFEIHSSSNGTINPNLTGNSGLESSMRIAAPTDPPMASSRARASQVLTTTTAGLSAAAITSIPINRIEMNPSRSGVTTNSGVSLLSKGDRITVIGRMDNLDETAPLTMKPGFRVLREEFVLSADQGATDTSLSVESKTLQFAMSFPADVIVSEVYQKQKIMGANTNILAFGATNPTAWWDFSDTSTLTLSTTGQISDVTDKMGSYDLAQTSTNRPYFDAGTLKLGSANFDGTDDYFTFSAIGGLETDTDFDFFFVIRPDDVSNYYTYLGHSNGQNFLRQNNSSQNWTFKMGNVMDNTGSLQYRLEADKTQIIRFSRTVVETTVTDYVEVNSYSDTNVETVEGSVPWTFTRLGARNNLSAGTFFTGNMGEVILYKTKLSDEDATQVYNYLKNKWL